MTNPAVGDFYVTINIRLRLASGEVLAFRETTRPDHIRAARDIDMGRAMQRHAAQRCVSAAIDRDALAGSTWLPVMLHIEANLGHGLITNGCRFAVDRFKALARMSASEAVRMADAYAADDTRETAPKVTPL